MAAIFFSTIINACASLNFLLIMQYVFSGHTNLTKRNLSISMLFCAFFLIPELLSIAETYWSYPFMLVGPILSILIFSKRRLVDVLLLLPSIAIYFSTQIIPEILLYLIFPSLELKFNIFGLTCTLNVFLGDFILLAILLTLRHILQKYEFTMNLSMREIIGALFLFFFCRCISSGIGRHLCCSQNPTTPLEMFHFFCIDF